VIFGWYRECDNGDIEFTEIELLEQLCGAGLMDTEFNVWVVVVELRERFGQQPYAY
jgi:hypothetical protein